MPQEKTHNTKLDQQKQAALSRVHLRRLEERLVLMSRFDIVGLIRVFKICVKMLAAFGFMILILIFLKSDFALELLVTIGKVTVGIFKKLSGAS